MPIDQVELELVLLLGLRGDVVRSELEPERLGLRLVEVVGEDCIRNVGRGQRPLLVYGGA